MLEKLFSILKTGYELLIIFIIVLIAGGTLLVGIFAKQAGSLGVFFGALWYIKKAYIVKNLHGGGFIFTLNPDSYFENIENEISENNINTTENTDDVIEEENKVVSYSREIIELSETLRSQFESLFNSRHYGESAERSSAQLSRVTNKFDKFKEILDNKLNKNEMTYERFLVATEEVYNNILDNIEKIKNIYEAVDNIDIEYIESRVENIKNAPSMTKEMQDELSSLRYRKSMAKKQIEGIDKILSVNEQAITNIDNMRLKLGSLNTSSTRAQYDIDTSIAELKKMASRVNEYSSDYNS